MRMTRGLLLQQHKVPHRRAKYDKKLLRARHAEGSLDVVVNDEPPAAASAT
jgi:hypothetical protein